jgi:hypothetical protein
MVFQYQTGFWQQEEFELGAAEFSPLKECKWYENRYKPVHRAKTGSKSRYKKPVQNLLPSKNDSNTLYASFAIFLSGWVKNPESHGQGPCSAQYKILSSK